MAFGVVTLAKPQVTVGVRLSKLASVQTAGAGASLVIADGSRCCHIGKATSDVWCPGPAERKIQAAKATLAKHWPCAAKSTKTLAMRSSQIDPARVSCGVKSRSRRLARASRGAKCRSRRVRRSEIHENTGHAQQNQCPGQQNRPSQGELRSEKSFEKALSSQPRRQKSFEEGRSRQPELFCRQGHAFRAAQVDANLSAG